MSKSLTDIHWNERALVERDVSAVNIADVSQRELETDFLLKHLRPADRVLDVYRSIVADSVPVGGSVA